MKPVVAVLLFTEVDRLVGHTGAGSSETHPKVREQLARQSIDLALPILAWPDKEREAWCYRNRKPGDPPPSAERA